MIVIFRRGLATPFVIGSLVVGVAWLLGAAMAMGIKINFVNFIAFPITFGIGVDYAVNVMARYLRDGERDVAGAIRGTGGAVGLCSLTTIIGYSSLLVAQNVGLFLFGLLAVLGEIACLTTAVVVMPAVLQLARRSPDLQSARLRMGPRNRRRGATAARARRGGDAGAQLARAALRRSGHPRAWLLFSPADGRATATHRRPAPVASQLTQTRQHVACIATDFGASAGCRSRPGGGFSYV